MKLVNDTTRTKMLTDHILNADRKKPVIVITRKRCDAGPIIPSKELEQELGAHAMLFYVSPTVQKTFNSHLFDIFGIVPTGLRVYKPNFRQNDSPLRHPVWNEIKINEELEQGVFYDNVRSTLLGRQDHKIPNEPNPILERMRANKPVRPRLTLSFT